MPKRLLFVDGIRGLLALIVVAYHITDSVPAQTLAGFPSLLRALVEWAREGAGDRVAMFSALSGFCLMLPVLFDPNLSLRGGNLSFLKRRGQRILPAYYAALALAVAVQYGTLRHGGATNAVFAYTCAPEKILSHVLLIHNVWRDHIFALIGPTWSLAVEAQLYVLFSLVLVPVWRHCGGVDRPLRAAAGVIGVAAVVILAALWLLSPGGDLGANKYTSNPWLAASFVIGMLGATVVHRAFSASAQTPLRWGQAALVVLVALASLYLTPNPSFGLRYILAGLLCTLLLGMCVPAATPASAPIRWLRGALESRGLQWVGACSYSIYLTHSLVLTRTQALALKFLPASMLPLVWAIEMGVAVGFGYVFYRIIEKPLSFGPSKKPAPQPAAAPVMAIPKAA